MYPVFSGWVRQSILKRRYRRLALSHMDARLPVIQRALDTAKPGYTLLVGDSHAELIGQVGLGDHPLVNAGIGGMSSRGCAIILPKFHMTVRASTAILSTGSNDIMARVNPRSKSTSKEFEEAIEKVYGWLHLYADKVLVLSIPPIIQLHYAPRDLEAVYEYSIRLERLAQQYNFNFLDPYASLRHPDTGLALPDALKDGVHLRDYASISGIILPFMRPSVSL